VIAIIDPDTRVNWRGAALLQEAGIDTIVGICENEAYKVNSDFFKRHNIQEPN
jgi:diaminohydroxyphosphoribosylaminopyrimidine deaminase/5-amino-6-(5-phosphoribosylamino)uracil reductase